MNQEVNADLARMMLSTSKELSEVLSRAIKRGLTKKTFISLLLSEAVVIGDGLPLADNGCSDEDWYLASIQFIFDEKEKYK